jgi:regulator of protease activity HflC (stomatin/prohibitin superfamily)
MLIVALVIIAVAAVAALFLLAFGHMLVNIGGRQTGLIERRYTGQTMQRGRVIAVGGEVGVQARALGPGLKVLPPFRYRVSKTDLIEIGEDEVGLVEAIDGNPLASGRIFAEHVDGHDSFQDGEAFLRNGGQKGPQVDFLPPGTYRINTYLFNVHPVPAVVVPQGQVGIVSARDGEPIAPGRLLARKVDGHQAFQDGQRFLSNGGQRGPQIEVMLPGRYRLNSDLFTVELRPATMVGAGQVGLVTANDGAPLPEGELVAPVVEAHDDYQNASAFLASGGQRGPQYDLLKPGTYYINPMMFDIKLDNVAVVQRGEVAVLVSNVGRRADEMGAEERARVSQEQYVVPKGYRGIQADVEGPGVYYLNRWAYIAYIVPTTNLTIDWAEESATASAVPATGKNGQPDGKRVQLFNPLSVISRDGFEIRVSVKVVIRVRPDQAPLMVAKIGSIENLIDHVIHPMIDSAFRNQASSTEAMNFMQDRAVEQSKAEARTQEELLKYHVECVSVLISQIILPQDLMEIQTRRVIAAQQQAMFAEQQRSEKERIATENTRAQADSQKSLVAAQIGVQVAEQTKQKTIIEAEGRSRAVELEGAADGARILAVGTATAEAYEKQVAAVGQANLAGIEVTKAVATAGLKITPDIVVGGGGGSGESSIFGALVAQLLASNRSALTLPAAPAPQQPASNGAPAKDLA